MDGTTQLGILAAFNPTPYMLVIFCVGNPGSATVDCLDSAGINGAYNDPKNSDFFESPSDSFLVYHDGVLHPQSYIVGPLDPEPKPFSEVVFGRENVNMDLNYCNCAVDEVQIFEVELKEDEVKLLYESL